MEGVELQQHRTTPSDLLFEVRGQGTPDQQLLDVQAKEIVEILERELEERPVIAFEVDAERERQCRIRLVAEGVRHLDPDVGVAVGFSSHSAFAVNGMAFVRLWIKLENPLGHRSRTSRTLAGQRRGSKPCFLK